MIPISMDVTSQFNQIANELKQVNGYLSCEKIVIKSIIALVDKDWDDKGMEKYLRDLAKYLEDMPQTSDDNNRINYLFAAGFINTLFKYPAWRNWVQKIKI